MANTIQQHTNLADEDVQNHISTNETITKIIPINSWSEFLYNLQFESEQTFKGKSYTTFLRNQWHVSIYFSAVYLLLVFVGVRRMTHRKPYHLRLPLALWSGTLFIFSLLGSIILWPEMVRVFMNKGIVETYCDNSYVEEQKIFYWYTLFSLSKVAELLDTAFIVLRKQKLITLHWIHHSLTLCYTFYVYGDTVSTARWMVCFNITVHTVMYGYYCLKAFKVYIPRSVSKLITTSQIVQMILCLIMNTHVVFLKLSSRNCQCSLRGAIAGFVLYLIFFYYFVRFFFYSYFASTRLSSHSSLNRDNDNNNNNNNNVCLVKNKQF